MSFPTLQVRPNEKNPKVLRSHEFLRQSNQLVERNLINTEGRKLLAKMLTKTVAEVKGIYALDEKRAELAKSGKLLEQLKSAHETSRIVMEDRFVLADLARQVQEKKLNVQRNYYECDHLRKSVQSTNAEIRREREQNEKRLADTTKATGELIAKSVSILKLLENSADVCKLRTMEEEKKIIVEEVDKLRSEEKILAEDIRSKRATLKAESKKSFQKTVIDCAKQYKLCQSLTPKLLKSKKNLELLKDEEENRRACGSLDETMQFDRSFVLASMDKEKSPDKRSEPPTPAPQKSSLLSTSFNEGVAENLTMEVEEGASEHDTTETNPKIFGAPVNPKPAPTLTPARSIKRQESFMETQKVLPREPSPEPEEPPQENEADRSIDIMEVEHVEEENDDEEQMEQDNQEDEGNPDMPETQKVIESVPLRASLSSSKSGTSPRHESLQKEAISEDSNNIDQGDNAHNDTVMAIEEEEVMSENGSNRSDNFSFNFFGNTKGGTSGDGNTMDTDSNFDFNFGGIGGGDDGSSNGSGGAFDFLNCGGTEEGQGSNNNDASDPFGFGASTGGPGGGDMSFNFNFEGDNDGATGSGAGENSTTFFNF
ncbi:unnamed protein product [Caenorhabditis brenneri]